LKLEKDLGEVNSRITLIKILQDDPKILYNYDEVSLNHTLSGMREVLRKVYKQRKNTWPKVHTLDLEKTRVIRKKTKQPGHMHICIRT
jgi:hypothetical protein